MTLDQLRIFLAVAEYMHFTRAAEALYITQPSVSAAIQNLEDEYGVKLFHRIGRRIELTNAGKLLQIEASKIIDQVALTERGLRELNNLQQGELKLGASQTIGNYWLPHLISRFKQQYPGIVVDCMLDNTEVISAGTASGLFDLAFVEGEVKPSTLVSLQQRTIGSDRLLLIVGLSHPWFGREVIGLAELLSTAWIMREKGSGTRQKFEQTLVQWGIDPHQLTVLLEMRSAEMVKAAVESGVGAAVISELLVLKELQLGTLRAIQITGLADNFSVLAPIMRPFFLLKHKERFQTHTAVIFEQMLISSQLHIN